MDNKSQYFYISGFISLSFFLFVCIAFVFVVIVSKKTDTFALKKDNYISVSIELPKTDTSSSKKTLSDKQLDKPIIEKQIEEEKTPQSKVTEKKEINIDSLFSNVWTKSIDKKATETKEKQIDKRVIDEIQRKISKTDTNEVVPLSSTIQNMNQSKADEKSVKSSTAPEVNEYLAKIQALVYDHFYPPKNSQGNSVIAVIELSSMGKVVDFRILTYSDNEALNSECDKIKSRLSGILFPKNPENSSGVYKITLISQE